MADDPDASGISVYPRLPVPKPQRNDSKLPKKRGGVQTKMIGAAVAIAVLAGGAGYLAHRPDHGGADKAKADIAAAQKAASVEKDRADGLAKQLDDEKAAHDAAEKAAAAASTKAADSESAAAKLQATIDKSQGSVSTEGDEIHLKLVDKVLFAVGDDKLTDKGKAVLDKVAVALKDLPDKQVWVQGHTDDQPIYIPPAPKKAEPVKKLPKGAKAPPPAKEAPPPVRFATNWELSASRALNVVHYLQDNAKIDPSRLAALAFGQYRPVSRSNKALNRRIEIVLVPKKAVVEKEVLQPAAGSGAGSAAPKKK